VRSDTIRKILSEVTPEVRHKVHEYVSDFLGLEWNYTSDSYYHIWRCGNHRLCEPQRLSTKETSLQGARQWYLYNKLNTMPETTVTIEDLKPLQKAYNKAVKEGKDYFLYKNQELITSYAKYLLEYLKTLKDGRL
jgi:hypothetical protein